jgi:hypothetical protein
LFGLVTKLKFDDQVTTLNLLELSPNSQPNSGLHIRTGDIDGMSRIGHGDTEHILTGHCTSIVNCTRTDAVRSEQASCYGTQVNGL